MKSASMSLLALALAVASCTTPSFSPEHEELGQTQEALWVPGPALNSGRFLHAVAAIPGGKYLITGGANSFSGTSLNALASAEVYDPATKKFTVVAPMQLKRVLHTGTAIDGKVVVVGGTVGLTSATARVEIYDPATDKWTDAATPESTHAGHTAVLLPTGKLLVIGGLYSGSVDEYDLATDTWVARKGMAEARGLGASTLLDDGRVLVTGGGPDINTASDSAEIYDPLADTWNTVPSKMATARMGHSSTKLKDGRILLVGGTSGGVLAGAREKSAEIFDPKTRTFTKVKDNPSQRAFHIAQLLPTGRVLVVGGNSDSLIGVGHLRTTDVYDPFTDTWRTGGTLARGRSAPVGILLGETLMVTGGWDGTAVDVTELLTASALGSSCTSGTACESGFCTDTVCCESRCDGPCEACDKSGKCQPKPSAEPSSGHPSCGGYVCGDDATKPACRNDCTLPSHCAKGFVCTAGKCVPNDAPKCSADRHTSISTATGVASPCGSYLCEDTDPEKKGKCRTDCRDTGDCAAGFVCALQSRVCTAAASSTGSSAGCDVSSAGASPLRGAGLLALCATLVLGALRRRRDRS